MDTIVTGAAFGASLVASGMYQPSLLSAQFSLSSWDMVQTFLTATGCSALVVELLRQTNRPTPPPRSWSSPSGLIPFTGGGNVLGGLLQGAGMALSSACPGMVFPQLALGVPTAPYTLAGAVVGGVFWSGVLRSRVSSSSSKKSTALTTTTTTSLSGLLGWSHMATFCVYEAVLLAAVVLASGGAHKMLQLDTVRGGVLISGAQLISMMLRGSMLGTSMTSEQAGDWILYLVAPKQKSKEKEESIRHQRPGTSAILFAVAMMGGAWGLAWWTGSSSLPSSAAAFIDSITRDKTQIARAVAGGFLMAVGSRLAGGCPSGHGISGLALMSLSSMVTMGAAFAAAIGLTWWL